MESIKQIINDNWMIISFIVLGALWIIVSITKSIRKDQLVNARTFFVKGAFTFDSCGKKVALCTYYPDEALNKRAEELGLDLSTYLENFKPRYNLDIEPIPPNVLKELELPRRITASKKALETEQQLFLVNEASRCVISFVRSKDTNPYETCWIGRCVQVESKKFFREILAELQGQLRKEQK